MTAPEIRCGFCQWSGQRDELLHLESFVDDLPADVCPKCGNEEFIFMSKTPPGPSREQMRRIKQMRREK